MGFGLFDHELVAGVDEKLVCLFVGKAEVDEVGDKMRQLVEDKILVVFDFLVHLFLFALKHAFDQSPRKKLVHATLLRLIKLFLAFLPANSVFYFG